MGIKLSIKKIIAVLLIIFLGATSLVISSVYAADAVDTARECTIRLKLPIHDLNSVSQFSGKLYKVASVNKDASYSLEDDFASISEINNVNSSTTAEEWQSYASKVYNVINKDSHEAYSIAFRGGESTIKTSVGLYLLVIDEIKTATDIYSFTPYLISVPGNSYQENGDDTWLYEVDSIIKAEQQPRFGNLTIEKTIETFNLSMKKSTCVFKVEAVRDRELVYSDVVAIDFSECGSRSVTIEHLPAGAQVTVTEIYSGGSYKNTSGRTQKAVIVADGEESGPVKVSFENTYNNKVITGGTAVVNSFSKNNDGSWKWERKSE